MLICDLRRIDLAHTQFAQATCGTIRLKLKLVPWCASACDGSSSQWVGLLLPARVRAGHACAMLSPDTNTRTRPRKVINLALAATPIWRHATSATNAPRHHPGFVLCISQVPALRRYDQL